MKPKFALYDKRTKTYFNSLWSISVIDRERYKFSKNQCETYYSIKEAEEKQKQLLDYIKKEGADTIDYLNSYDTLKDDVPKYKEKLRKLYNRFERLVVVEYKLG